MKNQTTENGTKETIRLEAFSDGVFAIAITLLVLELIETLHSHPEGGLLMSIKGHWESFLAYIIGFITILVCWINHHFAFEPVKKIDNNLIWINGFLLFLVTLTPFPTAILAEYLEKESTLALAVYGANYVLISLAAYLICRYAYRHHLVDEEFRASYHYYTLIYKYSIIYTLAAFFLCFVSIVIPIIFYIILFSLFASPKPLAARIELIAHRKRNHSRRKNQD